MTANITVSCDGHRNGQPCRGAFHTRWLHPALAGEEAGEAGWRVLDGDRNLHICPSSGHDEDER